MVSTSSSCLYILDGFNVVFLFHSPVPQLQGVPENMRHATNFFTYYIYALTSKLDLKDFTHGGMNRNL